MIEVKSGQRWKYVWISGNATIIEIISQDTSWGATDHFKCKIVQMIAGTNYRVNDITTWNFSSRNDSNHWTYLAGQDAPVEGA